MGGRKRWKKGRERKGSTNTERDRKKIEIDRKIDSGKTTERDKKKER